MEKPLLIIHVLGALALIGLVLIQKGKGAEAGSAFGGSSQSMFGSSGSSSFLVKLTVLIAVIFFSTSLGLTILSKYGDDDAAYQIITEDTAPSVPTLKSNDKPSDKAPAMLDTDIPAVESTIIDEASDIPTPN